MIEIMKASAGSGKTFNLAKTYLRLLLSNEDRYAYRHILAVTFTNKATEEMKHRILKELHILAVTPEKSDYFDDFSKMFPSSDALRDRSSEILSNILHDYGAFSISTIDGFFQQTLKAFSREIGQFASYKVELDKNSLVEESVDRVLDSLSEDNQEMLEWLTKSVIEELEQGGKYNLDFRLKSMAKGLKSDAHRAVVEKSGLNEDEMYSKENLESTKVALCSIMNDFINDIRTAAKGFVDAMNSAGINRSDVAYDAFRSLHDKFSVMTSIKQFAVPTPAVLKKRDDFESWFRKNDRGRFSSLESLVMPSFRNFCSLFRDGDAPSLRLKEYETAAKIVGQLDELGIAGDLYRSFSELLKEKNVLSLDDTNVILRDIIDGTDTPFIYEKLGVRFEHFLLDEFQDTSEIQWSNFSPLIAESDAYGNDNLIVGDVKQSIYRFRGSNWELMASGVKKDFIGRDLKEETLDSNYRSLRNVVEFNNEFFSYAATALDSNPGFENPGRSIASIYEDVCQKVKTKKTDAGNVEVVFCNPEKEIDKVYETVCKVHEHGAQFGEITVLVRNNSEGGKVASMLMSKGINVISDDSLALKASSIVRQTVSLISSAGMENDAIGSFLSKEIGTDVKKLNYVSLLDLCEQILRILKAKDEKRFNAQTQYIQSFMDFVQDYTSKYGNAIDAFLKTFDGSDPMISSPSDPESVRVMTIHKSKGLEFPYVIFPYAEVVGLFVPEQKWACPNVAGTKLEGAAEGVYQVQLSLSSNDDSLFHDISAKEQSLQYIDNINTFYVALTRAQYGLTVISTMPESSVSICNKACKKKSSKDAFSKYVNFSQILYDYLDSKSPSTGFSETEDTEDGSVTFSEGVMADFEALRREEEKKVVEKDGVVTQLTPGYPSFPLNPQPTDDSSDVRERGRLKFSADSVDYFCDEAKASTSARMNGTVLHAILSEVVVPGDLEPAVRRAAEKGDIEESQVSEIIDLLSKRISEHKEWFSEDVSELYSEVSMIGTDGKECRPDRVVVKDGKVTVIDYKFGEKNKKYQNKIRHYADIYRGLGYADVKTAIWYVVTGEVE